MSRALCAQQPDLFTSWDTRYEAASICARCEQVDTCLLRALRWHSSHHGRAYVQGTYAGVWFAGSAAPQRIQAPSQPREQVS